MEVKDAFSIYNFMEQLGYVGAIVFSIFLTIVSGYLIANVLDKIIDNKKLRIKIICSVSVIIFSCMIFITIKTISRNEDIAKANSIKSYMVLNKWKFIGFKRA